MGLRSLASGRTSATGRTAAVNRQSLISSNIIPNSNFENIPAFTAPTTTRGVFVDGSAVGSASNGAFGWAIGGPADAVAARFDPSVSHSGTGSLKLSNTNATGRARGLLIPANNYTGVSAANLKYLIPCKPNTSYTFSGWIKTNNVPTNGAGLQIGSIRGAGATPTLTGSTVSGTVDWTQLNRVYVTGPSDNYICIQLQNDTAGNVCDAWFDDLTLTETVTPYRNLPAARDSQNFGANTHAHTDIFADMRAANLDWARVDFYWSSIENTQGTYQWSGTDAVVAAAVAAGVSVLGIFESPPAWAKNGNGNLDPAYYANFVNYCNAVIARYGPQGVTFYEVWNEPNNVQFWPTTADPVAYANLLKTAYQGIKAINPGVTLTFGGLAPVSNGGGNIDSNSFLQTVYATIGAGYYDLMNYHPYHQNLAEIAALRATMVANGDGNKKMWFTEYGSWNGTSAGAVDLLTQANLAKTAIKNMRQLSYVEKLFFYDYVDDGTDLSNNQHNYGLTYTTGLHKPQWVAIRDTIANG